MKRKIDLVEMKKRMTELCKAKGITKERLWQDTGIERNYIANCVYVGYLPNTQSLVRISEYFDVTIDELLYGKE